MDKLGFSANCAVWASVVWGTNRLESLPAYVEPHLLHTLSDDHTLILILGWVDYGARGDELVSSVHQSWLVCVSTFDDFPHHHVAEFIFLEGNAWNGAMFWQWSVG